MKKELLNIAEALQQVQEKSMDAVDKKAVKGKFKDREDKDIDNDGDVDSSDKYLHKRRKKITNKVDGKNNENEVEITAVERYKQKVKESSQQKAEKVSGPADKIQSSKTIKQDKESLSDDDSKLNSVETPKEADAEQAIAYSKKEEKKSASAAQSMKEHRLDESYTTNTKRYVDEMKKLAEEILSMCSTLHKQYNDGMEASKEIQRLYKKGMKPSDKLQNKVGRNTYYADYKNICRSLQDCRDTLELTMPDNTNVLSTESVSSRFGEPVEPETRQAISIRHALSMMEERVNSREDHYRGSTKAQTYDDNWSGNAKKFTNIHKVATPDESDINKAVEKNQQEIGASLSRSVKYRHNDQQIGDKKPVGNDGK